MLKGFEVLPEALCYNTIFFWVVTQRAGSVAGCGLQRVQQTFYFRKKRLCVAGDNVGGGERGYGVEISCLRTSPIRKNNYTANEHS